MAKSIRNAFIRISAVNNTQNGIVKYSYDDIKSLLSEWSKTKKMKYYAKDHNDEKDDPNPHYHVLIRFTDPTPFEQIKNKFPYGDIESARKVKECVQYLVHMNDVSKTQYDFDTIYTNDSNVDKFKTQSYANQQIKVDDIIDKIKKGEIREFNLTEYCDINIFSRNKQIILNALEWYRRKVMSNVDRDITVMIFTGETGTYKTTYAKQYCKNQNKSFCISSSSNDPMQDYKGEDVLILDDIRDSTFKFHDFLKVLDNHTNSSIQSRYSNKAFIGDTIIITSSQKLSQWYYHETREDKEQLYRRIKYQFQFDEQYITMFEYSTQKHRYINAGKIPNINKFAPEKAKSVLLDTVKAMGVTLTEEQEKRIRDVNLDVNEIGEFYNDDDNENPFDKK